MAKKKTTKKQDPLAGWEDTGMGADDQGAYSQPHYYLNYNPGEITAKGTKTPGFFYIALDANEEADYEWELPDPWVLTQIPLGGEMSDAWVAPALPDVTWIAKREGKAVEFNGRSYTFGTYTAKVDMYAPNGAFLGDQYAQKKKHFVTIHEAFWDLPKPVIMTMNGKSRELMLYNDPTDTDWGHPDMGIGVVNELIDYTLEVNDEKGTTFMPYGPWKMTLIPQLDEQGEPVFHRIPTKDGFYYFNPIELVMDADPAKAVNSSDTRLKVQSMYEDWVTEWAKEWPRKGPAKSGDRQEEDADMNQDGEWTSGSKQATEVDDIPF